MLNDRRAVRCVSVIAKNPFRESQPCETLPMDTRWSSLTPPATLSNGRSNGSVLNQANEENRITVRASLFCGTQKCYRARKASIRQCAPNRPGGVHTPGTAFRIAGPRRWRLCVNALGYKAEYTNIAALWLCRARSSPAAISSMKVTKSWHGGFS